MHRGIRNKPKNLEGPTVDQTLELQYALDTF
ncbi:MAG: hypothetical protein ACI9YR_001299, partial [Bacteroidia bacterium]